jgi:hypothetical protein
LTFITDLNDLIKHNYGDVKKLREIRDTIRHDNFITTNDKKYIESLVDLHLKNQSSDQQVNSKIQLQPKPTTDSSYSKNDSAFSFSSNKKIGVFGGIAAAIAIIVIVGFTAINTPTDPTVNSAGGFGLLVNIDQTTYQRADIISISGDVTNDANVELSIKNVNGIKIWKETVNPKTGGQFSTLVIAGGGGWEDNGSYTLSAKTDNSKQDIEFKIVA